MPKFSGRPLWMFSYMRAVNLGVVSQPWREFTETSLISAWGAKKVCCFSGKLRQKWKTTAGSKFTNPGGPCIE